MGSCTCGHAPEEHEFRPGWYGHCHECDCAQYEEDPTEQT